MKCKHHGPADKGVWACPTCLVELREENQRMHEEIMRCWFVLKDAGLHPGRTDDVLHDVLRRELVK